MSVTHVVGVDPGLVHTGVVELIFNTDHKLISVTHEAVAGPDAQAVNDFVTQPVVDPDLWGGGTPHIFIEKYQPRSNFGSDLRMVAAVSEMHKGLPGSQVLLNTGVKKIVRRPLMELLGVWRFATTTHHQDLRSAARIAIYGMLKDESLNRLIADIVRDHLEGRTWDVRH